MWNGMEWNEIEMRNGMKLKCEWNWNVKLNEMWNGMEWNGMEMEMEMEMECEMEWNDMKWNEMK